MRLRDRVFRGDPDGLVAALNTLLARYNYPPDERRVNHEYDFQHAVLTPFFLLDVETVPEHPAGDGRSDIVVYAPRHIWVIELKVDKTAAEGMRQISARRYWQGFEHKRRRLVLLSMNFSRAARQIDDHESRLVVSGDPSTYPPEEPGQARPPPEGADQGPSSVIVEMAHATHEAEAGDAGTECWSR